MGRIIGVAFGVKNSEASNQAWTSEDIGRELAYEEAIKPWRDRVVQQYASQDALFGLIFLDREEGLGHYSLTRLRRLGAVREYDWNQLRKRLVAADFTDPGPGDVFFYIESL